MNVKLLSFIVVLVVVAMAWRFGHWARVENSSLYTLSPTKTETEIETEDAFLGILRQKIPRRGSFPRIGVIDSGLDLALAKKEGVHFSDEDLLGLNLVERVKGAAMSDDLFHGTGLFLQLAAKRNGFGMSGLLPEAEVFPIRVGNITEFTTANLPFSRIEEAFEIAKRRKIRILSFSLSNVSSFWSQGEMDKLLAKYTADFLVVVSSGNDGWDLSYGRKCTYIPVCNRAPNLVKVGARDCVYANRGEVVDIWVDSKSFQWRRVPSKEDKVFELKEVTSTSVAVPKVTAAVALLLAEESHLTPSELKRRLIWAKDRSGKLVLSKLFPGRH